MSAPLLPPNASTFERGFEEAARERHPLPAHLVGDTFDPDRCPAAVLPFLAWHLSIDLWDESWDEAKKRSVCRNAMRLHRLKTTPAGIRAHVRLTGAEVVEFTRPPLRAHLTSTMTAAEREDWLSRLPQVRIYPFAHRSFMRPGALFLSGHGRRAFLNQARPLVETEIDSGDGVPLGGSVAGEAPPAPRRFLLASRGAKMRARRATFIDPKIGVEVEAGLTIEPDGFVERVAIRSRDLPRRFLGHRHFAGHLLSNRPESGLLTVRLADTASAIAVPPGAPATATHPRRVFLRQPRQAGRFHLTGRCHSIRHTLRSRAPILVYDRIAFAIPGRHERRTRATCFMGYQRLGLAPFSAEIRIRIRQQRSDVLQPRFPGQCFLKPTNRRRFDQALQAVRVSKALRDRVLVTTTTLEPARFQSGLMFGEFDFGELRKVA